MLNTNGERRDPINIKSRLKQLTALRVINIYRKLFDSKKKTYLNVNHETNAWTGNYSSWQKAKADANGYEDKEILEKCKDALLKVKSGDAKYERDSVLFDEIQYSWGLLSGLQRAALENDGRLTVLDFGGSLGSTYFQNKEFLNTLKELQWCVVEQAHFVTCGTENFESAQLLFYNNIEDCLAKHKPNVLLLSGVLQYLEKPYDWIEKFISLRIPNIIIDRTAFVDREHDILTVQIVPESIYKASYPAWFFNLENFQRQFRNYDLIASFNSHEGYTIHLDNGSTASYKGFIFKMQE